MTVNTGPTLGPCQVDLMVTAPAWAVCASASAVATPVGELSASPTTRARTLILRIVRLCIVTPSSWIAQCRLARALHVCWWCADGSRPARNKGRRDGRIAGIGLAKRRQCLTLLLPSEPNVHGH